EVPAEAEAAVHTARARGDDQRAAFIFLDQPAVLELRKIADRILAEALDDVRFARRRPDLQEQRIARIAFAHARSVTAGHAQRERAPLRELQDRQRRIDAEEVEELGRTRERVLQCALPDGQRAHRFRGKVWYHSRPFYRPPAARP